MSARGMYDGMKGALPPGKREKHHGNKRKGVAKLKVLARREERAKAKQQPLDDA